MPRIRARHSLRGKKTSESSIIHCTMHIGHLPVGFCCAWCGGGLMIGRLIQIDWISTFKRGHVSLIWHVIMLTCMTSDTEIDLINYYASTKNEKRKCLLKWPQRSETRQQLQRIRPYKLHNAVAKIRWLHLYWPVLLLLSSPPPLLCPLAFWKTFVYPSSQPRDRVYTPMTKPMIAGYNSFPTPLSLFTKVITSFLLLN